MAGPKQGKNSAKKDKKKKHGSLSMPNIAAGLLPTAMFTAVPTTPPPATSPDLGKTGLATTLLNSSLLGRMFATPVPASDETLGHPGDVDGDERLSDPDTSLYDYDQDEADYSTVGYGTSTLDGRQSMSRRPRLHTPPSGGEVVYSIPVKSKQQIQPLVSDSELTNVSTDLSPQSSPEMSSRRSKKRQDRGSQSVRTPVEEHVVAVHHDPNQTVPLRLFDDVPTESLKPDSTLQSTITPRLLELQKQNEELMGREQGLAQQLDSLKREHEAVLARLLEQPKKGVEHKKLRQKKDDATDQILRQHEELIRTLQERILTAEQENEELHRTNQEMTEELHVLKMRHFTESPDGSPRQVSVLRRQIEDMKEESGVLKQTVHRLNVELSRYQAQYSPPMRETSNFVGLPTKGPIPSWMINTKYLSPLFLAYDEQLRERTELVHQCESDLEEFRERMEEIVKENERLHIRLEQASMAGPASIPEWQQIQEQAKLVLEENQLLMEQIEVHENKARDTHRAHMQEVAHLSKRIMLVEGEKTDVEAELQEVRQRLATTKRQYDTALADSQSRIPAYDHQSAVADLQRTLNESQLEHSKEVEELKARYKASHLEQKNLANRVADLISDNKHVEEEMKSWEKQNKRLQKKVALLQNALEKSESQGLSASHYLSSVVKMAEKTALERDTFAEAVMKEEHEKKKVYNKVVEGSVVVGRLEEKLRSYKQKANDKLASAATRLKEQDDEFNRKCQVYEREIKHLRLLVQEKDSRLSVLAGEKQNIEDNLDIMWQAASVDNERMKQALFNSTKRHQRDYGDCVVGGDVGDHQRVLLLSSDDER